MKIEEFSRALEKAALARGFAYGLASPASEIALTAFEARLGSATPPQVAMFYRRHNGLSIATPPLELFPVEALNRNASGMVPFCRFDGVHELSFDVRRRNAAEEWTIVNAQTGFQVTLTMTSFLTNKLFAWVKKGRTVWREETHQ